MAFCEVVLLLLAPEDDDGANGVAVIAPLLLLLFDVTADVTELEAIVLATDEVLWYAWPAGDDLDDVDD